VQKSEDYYFCVRVLLPIEFLLRIVFVFSVYGRCEMVKRRLALYSLAVYGALNKVSACFCPSLISNHEVLWSNHHKFQEKPRTPSESG